MRSLLKDHILVAVALCCNADDCRDYFCVIVFVEMSELQPCYSVHAPFCIGLNQASPFPVLFYSQVDELAVECKD